MKKIIIPFLIIASLTGCHNEELEKLKKENTELKSALDSIKKEEEKKLANLSGKVYWSSLGPDAPLYELNFIENNKVIFFIPYLGNSAYPYSILNGIITIHLMDKLSIRFQIINNKQLKLLQSSFLGNKKIEGVIYNCQN